MKTLIIYAHPETEGHCLETLRQVEGKLKNSNSEYEVMDLYKIDYDPLLREDELYTIGNRNVSQQNLEIQQKIKDSQNLIFIYPVWWETMPAIMKGFFDRILTPKFGYSFKKGGIVTKLLKGKKAVVFMSLGSPKAKYLLFSNIPKRVIKKRILEFCGIKTKVFQLYSARKLNEKKMEEIKNNVEKGFRFFGL